MSILIFIPLLILVFLNLPLKGLIPRVSFKLTFLFLLCEAFVALLPGTLDYFSNLSFLFLAFFYHMDNLTRIMLLGISITALSGLMVARASIQEEDRRHIFLNLVLLDVIGMNGIVIATDLFSLYVFLEITAAATWILIAFNKDKNALEGSLKYLILSAVASGMILCAIGVLMFISNTVSFEAISMSLKKHSNSVLVLIPISLLLAGFFIKSGAMPFHGWVPDAYCAAPTSVSILLGGIITKTAGMYTMIRLVKDVIGLTPALSDVMFILGTLSIVAGAFAALGQTDLKRMLAYSSISQIGYVLLGFGTGIPLGIAGAIFHLFNHTLCKTLLFVNTAAVEQQTGTCNMDKLGGLSSKMVFTGTTSIIGSLSAAGVPPLSGFWSKLMIVLALWQMNHYAYAGIAILASILTLAYLLSMQRRVFFGELATDLGQTQEAKGWIVIPAVVLSLMILGIGIFFPFFINTILVPIEKFLW